MAKIYARELREVGEELDRALTKYARLNSAHEGWAVIYEEVEELLDEVTRKLKKRRPSKMRREAIQIAAMAVRFAMEVCNDGATCKSATSSRPRWS